MGSRFNGNRYNETHKWGGAKNFKVYPFESEAAAVENFKAWFLKKGGTAWEHRAHFVQKPEMCGFFISLAYPMHPVRRFG